MDFARDHTLGLDLHAPLGEDYPVEFTCDYHVIALDLAFHASAFAENQAVRGNHVSFYMRVDPKDAGGFQRALKSHATIEKTGEFVLLSVFVSIFRSPLHQFALSLNLRIRGSKIVSQRRNIEAQMRG